MNSFPMLSVLAFVLSPVSSFGQASVATLAQAQATFAAADANKDSRLAPQEVAIFQLGRSELRGVDVDQDGFWSREEFLLFYRQRLVAAGVKPAADLESEATRVLAARKAKASGAPDSSLSQARRNALAGQPRSTAPAVDPVLQAADDLNAKALEGRVSAADFERVRNGLIASAQAADQAAAGGDPASGIHSELHRKLLQSLERLQNAAAAGTIDRNEYQALREQILHRTRNAAGGASASLPPTDPQLAAIEAGLQQALDQLEQRVAGGGAGREDFQRVRDQLIARARAAASKDTPENESERMEQSQVHRKLVQSLDRLEAAALEGKYSREEFQALRESLTHRARGMVSKGAGGVPRDPAAPGDAERELDQAFEALERGLEARQLTDQGFRRLQDLLTARARASAAGTDAAQAESERATYRKLLQSLDRLEKTAQAGQLDRAEFQAFKAAFTQRARKAVQPPAPVGQDPSRGGRRNPEGGSAPAGNPTPPGPAKRPDPPRGAGEKPPAPQPSPARPPRPAGEEPERPKPQRPPERHEVPQR